MRALCLIVAKPDTTALLSKKIRRQRKAIKDIIPVTGRADLCVLLQGNIDEINSTVITFKRIPEIVSTETMIEVEVNLGW